MPDHAGNGLRIPPAADDAAHYYLRKLQRHPAFLSAKLGLRAARQVLPNAWRLATQRFRQLPAGVIVGAAKAGTTQLFTYLIRHPRCFGGIQKEVNYFSHHADRPLAWYRSRFPLRRAMNRVRGVCLEASPSYLPRPEALQRMHDVLPDAAVIAILRDPVSRAFSQYQHERTRHREPRSFGDLVRQAVECEVRGATRAGAPVDESSPVSRYIRWGYYAEQIDALLQVYPREQVLVLDSADLFDDTNAMCQQVFDFLGLERFDVQSQKIYNRGYYRETIEPATAELLRDHYRPHDQRLVDLVGKRFRWMDAAPASTSERSAA